MRSSVAIEESEWQALLDCPPPVLEAEPEELSPVRAVEYLVALQREQSRLAALEARALVAVAGPHERSRFVLDVESGSRRIAVCDEVREEIAAALHRSPRTLARQIQQARMLVGPLMATREALSNGDITAAHVHVIASTAMAVTPDRCRAFEVRVLARAASLTPSMTGTVARRILAAVDRAGAERRRQAARKDIDVVVYPENDGLATLLARFPAEQAARVHAAIDARARAATVDCDATLGQRRAQGLVDAVCGTTVDHDRAAHERVAVVAEIHVVVDAATLLGIDDGPATITLANGEPETITAGAVRDLLADPDLPATLRRLVADPVTSDLLDQGRRSYRVTDALRSYLVARDGTCRMPGCPRRASACQIDHAHAWGEGGPSDRSNLGPLCLRHHQLKTHGGWRITESRSDGSAVWRSPQGRMHVFQPYRALPLRQ